jgi:hypothetical protein
MNNFLQSIGHTEVFYPQVYNAATHLLASTLTAWVNFHFYPHLPVSLFGFVFRRLLILRFATSFLHSYMTSQRNGRFSCAGIKRKTLPQFCFPEHNCLSRRWLLYLYLNATISMKNSFILLANNVTSCKGPLHHWELFQKLYSTWAIWATQLQYVASFVVLRFQPLHKK